LLLVTLGACNQVFDLGATRGPRPPGDLDHDGVTDDIDDCPLVADPAQADRDYDGLGDACDPCVDGPQSGDDIDHDGVDDACDSCLTGANHDEDGDGLADGCDVCPGVADDQADGDGDGVGDACDADPMPRQHRLMFDGFAPPRPDWNTGFSTWHATDDGYAPDDPSMGNPVFGPWNRTAKISGVLAYVDVSITLPPAPTANDLVGVNLVEWQNAQPLDGCSLFPETGPTGAWVLAGEPGTFSAGTHTFHLYLHPSTLAGYMQIGCTVDGHDHVGGIYFDDTQTWVPSLLTTVPAEFNWIDVIE
jgi:hypothetical protein